MENNNIIAYLINKNIFQSIVTCEPITIGASGAKLYVVDDGNKKYVIKNAPKSLHQDVHMMNSYKKELSFYELNQVGCHGQSIVYQKLLLPYIPNIIYSEDHKEYGIILVMDYYTGVSHSQWNLDMQKRVVDLCARFNSIPIDSIAPLHLEFNRTVIDQEFTTHAFKEWKEVLNQHKGRFDEASLDEIYQNLDVVCPILNSEPHYLCHGDFHPENILFDGEQLYICDWQNVGIGKCIGDISFFISRGIGMGIDMNADQLLDYYCERLSLYKGMYIDKVTLLKEKYASNVLCTFSYWANYLKDSTYERVASHFNEMVKEYHYLIQ